MVKVAVTDKEGGMFRVKTFENYEYPHNVISYLQRQLEIQVPPIKVGKHFVHSVLLENGRIFDSTLNKFRKYRGKDKIKSKSLAKTLYEAAAHRKK